MKNRNFLLLLSVTFAVAMGLSYGIAAPSLDGADRLTIAIDTGEVDVDGDPVSIPFTVIMDHQNPSVWYYVPGKLKLSGNPPNKLDFSLLRYSIDTDALGQEKLEGGVLQFGVTFESPGKNRQEIVKRIKSNIVKRRTAVADRIATIEEAIDDLSARIAAEGDPEQLRAMRSQMVNFQESLKERQSFHNKLMKSDGETVNLTMMPFKEVEIAVFAPGSPGEDEEAGTLVARMSSAEGAGPKFEGQMFPFTMELTRAGTAVYNALTTRGNAGVQVIYTVKYDGAAPPAFFSIEVDWEQAYNHFSDDMMTKVGAAGNIMGVVDLEAGVTMSNASVIDDLKKSGAIKIDLVTTPYFTEEQMNPYLEPIIQKIYEEIFDKDSLEMVSAEDRAKADESVLTQPTMDTLRVEEKEEDPKSGGAGGNPPTEGDDSSAVEDLTGVDPGKAGGSAPSIIPKITAEVRMARKSIDQFVNKKYKVNFSARPIIEESTAVGGFIGLGNSGIDVDDKDLMSKYVLQIIGDGYREAVLMLPPMDSDSLEEMGVTRVELTAQIVKADGNPIQDPDGLVNLSTRRVYYDVEGEEWQDLDGEALEVPRLKWEIGLDAEVMERLGLKGYDDLRFDLTSTLITSQHSQTIADTASVLKPAFDDPSLRANTLDVYFDTDLVEDVKRLSIEVTPASGKTLRRTFRSSESIDELDGGPIIFLLPGPFGEKAPVSVEFIRVPGAKLKFPGITEDYIYIEDVSDDD